MTGSPRWQVLLAGSVCWLEASGVTSDTLQRAPGIAYFAYGRQGYEVAKKTHCGIPDEASDAPGLSPIKSRSTQVRRALQRSQRSLKQLTMGPA